MINIILKRFGAIYILLVTKSKCEMDKKYHIYHTESYSLEAKLHLSIFLINKSLEFTRI